MVEFFLSSSCPHAFALRDTPGLEEPSEVQAGLRGWRWDWSRGVREEDLGFSDAKLLGHKSNNILKGAGTQTMVWLRAKLGLAGLPRGCVVAPEGCGAFAGFFWVFPL